MPPLSLLERLLPPGLDENAALRSRMFVRGWVLTGFAATGAGALYAAGGIWSQVATTALLIVAAGPMLLLHKRGVHFGVLSNISLVIGSIAFGLGALAQRPADYTSFALILLMPLIAGFLLGKRGVLPWMIISFVWGSFVAIAIDREWLFDFVDPMPIPSHVVNFGIGILLVYSFSRTFDDAVTRTLDRLKSADAARRAFLANVSHEIRTPMNGVLGMTEVLLLESATPSQREQLKTIQRSGRTLVALINDLLDLSKMEAGKLEVDRADFNIVRLLSDVQALAAPQATTGGLELVVHRGTAVPERLRGDGIRLGQVLNNLLSNAVKFTARGRVRLLVTALGADRYRFAVEDTGPGIPAEILARLFTPFQQADSSTTRRFGGTGLGLALSQQLVTLMGGRIEVASVVGEGSTFSFDLTLDAASAVVSDAPLSDTTAGARSVLVVDDNPINLRVAMQLVRKAGCEAEGVANGVLALEALDRRSFDLVLMDCHMPEMDGFEATERIRALGGERGRTPIVALTASAMPDEIAACKRVGMNSVLAKPVSFAALQEVLRTASHG